MIILIYHWDYTVSASPGVLLLLTPLHLEQSSVLVLVPLTSLVPGEHCLGVQSVSRHDDLQQEMVSGQQVSDVTRQFTDTCFILLWTKLSHELVRNRSQELRLVVLGGDNMSFSGCSWESLAVCFLTTGLGLLLLDVVGVDSVQEVLPALAVLHVLDTNIDSLGQDLAAHSLVHHNTQRSLRHVEHAPSLAVVGLVRHSLLEGSTTWNSPIATFI